MFNGNEWERPLDKAEFETRMNSYCEWLKARINFNASLYEDFDYPPVVVYVEYRKKYAAVIVSPTDPMRPDWVQGLFKIETGEGFRPVKDGKAPSHKYFRQHLAQPIHWGSQILPTGHVRLDYEYLG